MTATIQTLLLLIAVLVVVAVVARRFNTAPSILLVIAGIALALIPGLPRIELAPELVLLGILPRSPTMSADRSGQPGPRHQIVAVEEIEEFLHGHGGAEQYRRGALVNEHP